MAKVEVLLPAMGEGVFEATITRWLAEIGAELSIDEPMVEIATDKVDSELPAPASGTLTEILFKEGEIPRVGQVIAIIDDGKEDKPGRKKNISEGKDNNAPQKNTLKNETPKNKINTPETPQNKVSQKTTDNYQIAPFIRYIAKSRGIELQELLQIKGTGAEGKLTKNDINNYIVQGRPFKMPDNNTKNNFLNAPGNTNTTAYNPKPGEKAVEMHRTRKIIARHMVESKHIAPHVSSSIEVDLTKLVNWRNKHKQALLKNHNTRLTYTPILIQVLAKAIAEFPGINVSVHNETIIYKPNINIGIATALSNGNLIVPVIKNANHFNLLTLAKTSNNIINRARENKLKPHEIQNGTFTITNLGQFNNVSGIPIINQPQVAILAAGAIIKKPSVVYTNGEPGIGIRDIMALTMSYDHRVVDGALGGGFLNHVADLLANFPDIFFNELGF